MPPTCSNRIVDASGTTDDQALYQLTKEKGDGTRKGVRVAVKEEAVNRQTLVGNSSVVTRRDHVRADTETACAEMSDTMTENLVSYLYKKQHHRYYG